MPLTGRLSQAKLLLLDFTEMVEFPGRLSPQLFD
jgi:hypothetical protein